MSKKRPMKPTGLETWLGTNKRLNTTNPNSQQEHKDEQVRQIFFIWIPLFSKWMLSLHMTNDWMNSMTYSSFSALQNSADNLINSHRSCSSLANKDQPLTNNPAEHENNAENPVATDGAYLIKLNYFLIVFLIFHLKFKLKFTSGSIFGFSRLQVDRVSDRSKYCCCWLVLNNLKGNVNK